MIDITDITKRTWYLYSLSTGFYLFALNKDVKINDFLPGYKDRYDCRDIDSFATSEYVTDKLKNDFVGKENINTRLYHDCHGVMFNNTYDLFKMLSEWNYVQGKRGLHPLLVFSRDTLNSVKLNCIVSNMCIDNYFLLQSEFPDSDTMYRNQATLTSAISIPRPILPMWLIRYWSNWLDARKIFGYSKKYYCVEYYGYPTKLNLLRGKNLYKDPQNEDMVRYLLFYTLVMNKYDIEKLQDIGFVWNRYNQVWVGAGGNVDEGELKSFIDRDNMATPDTMGFVPEWYANLDIAKQSSAKERGGNKFDNSVLWKQFLSA